MSTLAVDPQLEKRNVLARATKLLKEDAPEIFEPTEDAVLVREGSGLGYWVGVKSVRHNYLFDLLEKKYFTGFQKHSYNDEFGRAWIRFGYDYNLRVPRLITDVAVKLESLS